MSKQSFEELVAKAEAAGMAAGQGSTPRPMVVGEADGLFGSGFKPGAPTYFVADGVCGFAWVKIKGNTPFGRWMKANGKARPGYPTGLQIWVREFGQSMQRKEAYAAAYTKVLSDAGIWAYADSRMD